MGRELLTAIVLAKLGRGILGRVLGHLRYGCECFPDRGSRSMGGVVRVDLVVQEGLTYQSVEGLLHSQEDLRGDLGGVRRLGSMGSQLEGGV